MLGRFAGQYAPHRTGGHFRCANRGDCPSPAAERIEHGHPFGVGHATHWNVDGPLNRVAWPAPPGAAMFDPQVPNLVTVAG